MIIFGPLWLILPLVGLIWIVRAAKASGERQRQDEAVRRAAFVAKLPINKIAGIPAMRLNEDSWP